MNTNSAGIIFVLALLAAVFFFHEKENIQSHLTPAPAVSKLGPAITPPPAPPPAPVLKPIPVPPLEREPVTLKKDTKKPTRFSSPGHRVFYLVGDDKKVHYCYEVENLPGLTTEVADAALALYGEKAPAGKLATGFICL